MASQPSARCTIAGGVDCVLSRVDVDGWRINGPAHRVSVHVNDSKISHPAVSAGPFAPKPLQLLVPPHRGHADGTYSCPLPMRKLPIYRLAGE